jgi:hypothetical protein
MDRPTSLPNSITNNAAKDDVVTEGQLTVATPLSNDPGSIQDHFRGGWYFNQFSSAAFPSTRHQHQRHLPTAVSRLRVNSGLILTLKYQL